MVRESTFGGWRFDEAARRTAAAALEAFFQDNITLELSALGAMLPQCTDDGGMDQALLCSIFRSVAESSSLNKNKAVGGGGALPPQQQTLRVHVGGENFLSSGVDDDNRTEFASLASGNLSGRENPQQYQSQCDISMSQTRQCRPRSPEIWHERSPVSR